MILDGECLKYAHTCASFTIRAYRGRTPPAWLAQHYHQLNEELRLSPRGHESSCETAESGTLSTMQVAEMLGKNKRWVHRHKKELGGHQLGDRWRFSRTTVEKYLRERETSE